ncbi:MAG: sigma-70 family RNA polymerase sigma factor [Abditibacteriota bacterium]|nr:sigma-70 family RNA polymerase sigma factor [Abditibacteriota bacterium]
MTNQNILSMRRVDSVATEKEKQQQFAELVEIYRDKAFAVAYNMTLQNRDEAEDLVQEAFLRAYRFFDKYDPQKPFDNWLLTIMRNIQIDKVRRNPGFTVKSVDDDTYDSGGERYNFADEDQPTVEDNAISNDYSEKVMAVVNTMPEHFRTMVLLADAEGLSYEEIAEVTRTNVGTVRSRIHRGRKLLREKLVKAGLDKDVPDNV